MDVRHAVGEIVGNGDPLEESAHDDQIDAGLAAAVEDGPAEVVLAGEVLRVDDGGGDAGVGGVVAIRLRPRCWK